MLNPANLLVRPIAGQSERRVPKKNDLKLFGLAQRQGLFTCASPAASGAVLHFGAVGRPPKPRLWTRDPGRFEHQSANAGASTHTWVTLDVPRKFGCLSLRFGFDSLVWTPTFRTGSSGFYTLDPDPVGTREPVHEQGSGTSLVGEPPRGGALKMKAVAWPRAGAASFQFFA